MLFAQCTVTIIFFVSCTAAILQVQRGNNDFATKLYNTVSKTNENILFSPLSVHLLLTLCYQGASGATLDNLRDILHLPNNQTEAASQYAKILTGYNKYDRDAVVLIANNVFLNANYELRPSFRSVAEEYFASDVTSIDFTKTSSANEINEWVTKKTDSKINNIICEEDLDEDTRLVLINAIYFKSSWLQPFKKSLTHRDTFYVSDTHIIDCEMMRTTGEYFYSEIRELDAKILKLPYANRFYFVVILPNNITGIKTMEKALIHQDLIALTINAGLENVEVFLPKFKIEMSENMNEHLEEIGLQNIFSDKADFPMILNSHEPLKVSKVVQKTFIDVNENGTEAAAATAAVIRTRRSASLSEYTFKANRPFLFYIIDSSSTILFLGKLTNPKPVIRHDEL